MTNRFTIYAGWSLFAGAVALASGLASHAVYSSGRPSPMGYAIPGVVAEEDGAAAAGPSLDTLLASADLSAGEALFGKCSACHSIEAGGANGLGPNLHGVVGDAVGSGRGGYVFSEALKSKGGTWDFATLDAWLKSPRDFAPGTKMTFAGLSNPADRANLIAWLNTQGSNLPLPVADSASEDMSGDSANASEVESAVNSANGAGGAEE